MRNAEGRGGIKTDEIATRMVLESEESVNQLENRTLRRARDGERRKYTFI